jgi:hypothetical protein
MDVQMSGTHQATYDALFGHPISRNLQWHDIRSMLESIAQVSEEHNGNVRFIRHGQTLTIHPPKHKDLADTQELTKIRHFLERSAFPEAVTIADSGHRLVVINHREARVYQTEMRGAVPERIVPYDPDGLHQHIHYVEDESNKGKRLPELKSFYEAVAHSLVAAEQILIFGSSTGTSSAMEQLLADLQKHHSNLAKRVIGTMKIDEKHLTDDQLLAKAREFYLEVNAGG